MNPILLEVQAERDRQIAKGYDAAHDDGATAGELAQAAGLVLLHICHHDGTTYQARDVAGYILGKYDDRRRQIIIALAMGLAEIERLDRMEKA